MISFVLLLLIAWIVALLVSATFGGLIHLIPVVAVVLAAVGMRRGRRARR